MNRRGMSGVGRFRERIRRFFRGIIQSIANAWNTFIGFFSWIGHSVGKAWGSRHLRYMIQGLPALFATVVAIILVIAVFTQGKEHLAQPYNVETQKALANQQFELARTYAERAIELKDHDDEDRFNLVLALSGEAGNIYKEAETLYKEADTLAKANKTTEAEQKKEQANSKLQSALQQRAQAYAIANTLAPKDRTGYPPAHLWMARVTLMDTPQPKEDTLRLIENHLFRAYKGGLEKDATKFDLCIKEAAEQLGRLLWTETRKAEAEPYLKQVADRKPILRLTLGQYYRETNRPDDAKRMFESAADHFRRKCDTDLDSHANIDDHESRLNWIQALIVQDTPEKMDEAFKVADKGHTLKPDEVRYTQIMSLLCADKEQRLSKQPNTSMAERLAWIQRGLQLVPNNPTLLRRLVQLSEQKGDEGEKSKKMMEGLLADEKAAPVLYFILGSRAFSENKLDVAQYHWEQAYKLDPSRSPIVANNLAAVMIQPKDVSPQVLDQALEMINSAIKKMNAVQFYDTRGQIYFKQGKYKEAIDDLVLSLKNTPESNLAAHEMLATAYEKVGDKVRADAQRQKAEELRSKGKRLQVPISKPWNPDEKPDADKSLPPADGEMPQLPVGPPADKPEPKEKTPESPKKN